VHDRCGSGLVVGAVIEYFLSRFRDAGCDTLLDVGCGIGRHAEAFQGFSYLGMDICREYIEGAPGGPYVVGDARQLPTLFVPDSFDAVLWYDSLEHLTKSAALNALRFSFLVARRCVGVFTPLGFCPQHHDAWGKGNPHQRHLSGWTVKELVSEGFECDTRGGKSILAVRWSCSPS